VRAAAVRGMRVRGGPDEPVRSEIQLGAFNDALALLSETHWHGLCLSKVSSCLN
jgi:hypothetical protein